MKKTVQVHKGFTLVELLVVIAIIAILAAVVVLIINPLELTRRGRDAARLSDFANLQNAINVSVQEATNSGQNIACNGSATCTGSSNSTSADNRKTDGSGWIKINLGVQTSVSVPVLPVDSVNSAEFHYTYCGSGEKWIMKTVLESAQQNPKMHSDGLDDAFYETGSDLSLSCTY